MIKGRTYQKIIPAECSITSSHSDKLTILDSLPVRASRLICTGASVNRDGAIRRYKPEVIEQETGCIDQIIEKEPEQDNGHHNGNKYQAAVILGCNLCRRTLHNFTPWGKTL